MPIREDCTNLGPRNTNPFSDLKSDDSFYDQNDPW